MASRLLITGASGNVGRHLLRHLEARGSEKVLIARRKGSKAESSPHESVDFDFTDPRTFAPALARADYLFLLRPPALADVKRYFTPLFEALAGGNIKGVVFLSVQGAESSSFSPHHKIEIGLRASGVDWVFLRPGYFMENLINALGPDIRERREMVLPAGKAAFNWTAAADLGEATAKVLGDFPHHRQQAYALTGPERLDFFAVARLLSQALGKEVRFRSVSPWHYWQHRRKAGDHRDLVLVKLLLHFLPRLKPNPPQTNTLEQLLGREATTLVSFIQAHHGAWQKI